ncbi:hypothetical protein AVEN_261167-1, partial [Araneus ventricosus]
NDLPARIKRIDCVNVNAVFRVAFGILRTLLPVKILRRIRGSQPGPFRPLVGVPAFMVGGSRKAKKIDLTIINLFLDGIRGFFSNAESEEARRFALFCLGYAIWRKIKQP